MVSIFSISVIIIFLVVLSVVSFFFSSSETSIIALSKIRLRHMIAKGVKRAHSIQRLLTKSDKLITGILIGNNVVNVAISSIAAAVFIYFLGAHWGVIVATIISSLFILIVCEITPKTIALKHTEKMALLSAPIMEVFIKIFNPVIRVFNYVGFLILKILRIETPKRSPLITEEELRLMIEMGKEEGVLTDEERKMLHRIFEFGDIKVSDVMIEKDKMVMVDVSSSLEEVLKTFAEEGHARLPVYRQSRDNIIGLMYARDLLYILNDKQLFVLEDLLHEVCFVSHMMRVNEILRKFQAQKIQIAIVTGENKEPVGLVTLEDLIEEIVGEIEEQIP